MRSARREPARQPRGAGSIGSSGRYQRGPVRPGHARSRAAAGRGWPAGARRPAQADRLAVCASHASSSTRSASLRGDPRVDVLDGAARVDERVRRHPRASTSPARPVAGCAPPPSRSSDSCRPPFVSRSGGVVAGRGDARGRQPVDQGAELELAEALRHGAAVVAAGARRFEVEGSPAGRSTMRPTSRDRNADSRCSASRSRSFPFTSSRCSYSASSVPNCWRRRDGGLLPDPRHAGDVVGGVALERLVVEHLVGAQAVALHDPRLVVDDGVGDPHPGREEPDVVVDQLQAVQVAGHDVGVHARARRPRGPGVPITSSAS